MWNRHIVTILLFSFPSYPSSTLTNYILWAHSSDKQNEKKKKGNEEGTLKFEEKL